MREFPSRPYAPALAAMSQADTLSQSPLVREARPAEDGVHEMTPAGSVWGSPCVRFVPYCEGPPGSYFYLSVVKWNRVAATPEETAWVGVPVADFLCVAGDVPGPLLVPGLLGTESGRTLTPQHRLCEAVYLVAGSLGFGEHAGNVISYGPGRAAPAEVKVFLDGGELVQFDFAYGDPHCPVPMNALWARAS